MSSAICGCGGIRVWRGYRRVDYWSKPDKFVEKLGSVFIPATAQLLYPHDLKAYFAVIGNLAEPRLPDEVALVVYGSKQAYYDAKTSVVGKAYGMLHGTLFNFTAQPCLPRSTSDFPKLWNGRINLGEPVYLFERERDWHSGQLRLSLALVKDASLKDTLPSLVQHWLDDHLADQAFHNLILLLEKDYLMCWEHLADESAGKPLLDIPALAPYIGAVDTHDCQTVKAAPIFQFNDPGINTDQMVAFDVRG